LTPSALQLAELLREERDDLEEIPHEAEVGDLEDWGVGVLVHGADHLRGTHPRQVLDGARYPAADVELRGDGPAGLADLKAVRLPPRTPRGARAAHGRAEVSRQLLQQDEVLGAL